MIMDLRSLVDEFGGDVEIETVSGGEYVDGKWIDPTQASSSVFGVLLSLSYEDIQTLTGGEYTTQDKKLITKGDALVKIDDYILSSGEKYKVEKLLDQNDQGMIKSFIAIKVVD